MFVLKNAKKITKNITSPPPTTTNIDIEEFIILWVRRDVNHLSLSTKFSGTAPCGASALKRNSNSEDNLQVNPK